MSEPLQTFRIGRSTGTHSDAFAAVGLADVIRSAHDIGVVRLTETEAEFEVHVPERVTRESLLKRIPQVAGYPFLKSNDRVHVPPGVMDFVDYKVEKDKADRRREVAKTKRKNRQTAVDVQTQQIMQEEQLRDDWRLLQVLNTLRGDETTNRVHVAIVRSSPEQFRHDLTNGFDGLVRRRPADLGWNVTTVQLFTPIAAKGYGRLKPMGTDRNDKTKEQWADPFTEWLRYRGYFRIACPFFQGEDVRLICPIPHDISVGAIESVARELRRSGVFGGSSKLDALVVLRLVELLVRHSEEYHDPDAEVFPGLSLIGKTPAEAISGVTVTHYQSLGNAKVVSAMSTLALPGWFSIRNRQDADEWLAILREHQRIVASLNPGDREIPPKNKSDEIGILQSYRRFLERRGDEAIWSLIEFMERYGPFVMRANGSTLNGRYRWLTRFTDDHFRRVVMGTNAALVDIVNNPGFRAVARAVRQATVTAQNKRARYKAKQDKEDTWREIRYELLHDLQRTRRVPGNAFVECVSEFISRYNYENARRRETEMNPMAAPANLSDEELGSFLALVDQHGASLLGALLAAYGSCKEKREPEETETVEVPTKTSAI